MSRSTGRPAASSTSSLVEFVPQSTAATAPTAGNLPVGRRGELLSHPTTDGVAGAGEEVGVVAVQALHPDAGSADATARAGSRPALGYGGVALGGCALVGSGQLLGRHRLLGPRHPSRGFESRDGGAGRGSNQPVPGGHRRAVVQQGVVAYDDRSLGVSDDNLELALRPPAEEAGHRLDLVRVVTR